MDSVSHPYNLVLRHGENTLLFQGQRLMDNEQLFPKESFTTPLLSPHWLSPVCLIDSEVVLLQSPHVLFLVIEWSTQAADSVMHKGIRVTLGWRFAVMLCHSVWFRLIRLQMFRNRISLVADRDILVTSSRVFGATNPVISGSLTIDWQVNLVVESKIYKLYWFQINGPCGRFIVKVSNVRTQCCRLRV